MYEALQYNKGRTWTRILPSNPLAELLTHPVSQSPLWVDVARIQEGSRVSERKGRVSTVACLAGYNERPPGEWERGNAK